MTVLNEKLAIDGGTPCVVEKPDTYLHGPAEIGQAEIDAVTAVLRTKNLFRFGRQAEQSPTAQFEKRFAALTQTPYALAVNSGTSALVAGLVGIGVGSGDEVIVPAYTYIATAAAVLARGAFPVIAEVDDTLTLDPADVARKITPRTKAIIPVHMRGLPCQMDELLAVAQQHKLRVLEDCAQANGGQYRGRPLGSLGDCGAFSLQQFKIITAGEGGAVVAKDKEIFDRAACYHDSAYAFWKDRDNQLSIKPFLGENYRMNEMSGALVLAQLDKRDAILKRCRSIKRTLLETVRTLPGFTPQRVADEAGDCGLVVVFYVADSAMAKRVAAALRAEGMGAGSIFDEGIPDRHIYYHWDYVLEQRTPDHTGYPWRNTPNPCHVKYDRQQCPRSTELLGKTVALSITQRMSDAHVASCAVALRKVHQHLCS